MWREFFIQLFDPTKAKVAKEAAEDVLIWVIFFTLSNLKGAEFALGFAMGTIIYLQVTRRRS